MIDCRPKGYQPASNIKFQSTHVFFPSQWPKQIFSACMGDFRCELWTPEKVVVGVFEYPRPEFIIGVYFKSNATGHAW